MGSVMLPYTHAILVRSPSDLREEANMRLAIAQMASATTLAMPDLEHELRYST